jgi:CRISPR-associated endonuclease/helicase Cas3
MRDRELIRIPEDIRPLVENVYDMSSVEQEEIEKWASLQFDETLKKGAAREYELPEPDEKSFCFIESGNAIFDDMENSDSYLSAKTRLGEPTTRVAFLPEDEAITLTEESMRSKSTARRVMSYSLSLRNKQLRVVPGAGFEPPMEGTGLLKGVWIYRLKGDRYDVKDDRIAGYRTDSKLGLMIERK